MGQVIVLARSPGFVPLGARARAAAAGGWRGRGLGLERLEGRERALELGLGGGAVAHQRLDAAGVVAVADQGEPEVGIAHAPALEHLGLHPVGAHQAPGGADHALREHALKRADRGELG